MKKLLIVVDFQNDFVTGSLGFPEAEKLIPIIKEKIKNCLASGYDLIYTLDTHDRNYSMTTEGKRLPISHCLAGTYGHRIVGECDFSAEAKAVFEKETFPSLDLAIYLRDHPYDEVELCGLVSHICVFSNAVMVKAALPNAVITVDAEATASADSVLEAESFDVLGALHIDAINRK